MNFKYAILYEQQSKVDHHLGFKNSAYNIGIYCRQNKIIFNPAVKLNSLNRRSLFPRAMS